MFSLYSFTLSILLQLYKHYFTDVSLKVEGYCQNIPPPSSSSETIITSTQSVPTNSTRSIPTHLTQSVTTNSTQRNINQNDTIANTTLKEYSFFRRFLISFDLWLNKYNWLLCILTRYLLFLVLKIWITSTECTSICF